MSTPPSPMPGRLRGVWREEFRTEVPGERVRLGWASWEYTAELRAAACVVWLCVGVAALALAALFLQPPPIRFQLPDGRLLRPREVHHGRLLGGNTAAALDTALALGRQLARARFAYDPWRLNAGLQTVMANATPRGRAVLLRTLDRDALSTVVLGDSGVARIREFGAGAYSYGEAPGHVRVVVPLIGRLWSRHVAFDGYRSGLPLAAETHLWMLRDEHGRWRLDSISGEVLDPGIAQLWRAYAVNRRPLPQVVVNGAVIPPVRDSVWVASWARGTTYTNQN